LRRRCGQHAYGGLSVGGERAVNVDSYEALLVEREGRVLTIRMNRPETMNAVDGPTHEELSRVFVDAASDEESDVVVLTGSGSAFSSGGDADWLEAMADDPDGFERVAVEAKRIIFSMLDCEKPIVAKVNGHAVGLGATLALFCDVIFAAEHAKIGDPHVAVGLVAGDGGAVIWPQLVGYARAKEYLMTGELVGAPEAERIGLINHAIPADDLDERVAAFADRLVRGPRKAVRWTKASINIGLKQLAHSVMDACLAYELVSNVSTDHREGIKAFRERRKPVFEGR
jgi:enoyl-CoA hydratase